MNNYLKAIVLGAVLPALAGDCLASCICPSSGIAPEIPSGHNSDGGCAMNGECVNDDSSPPYCSSSYEWIWACTAHGTTQQESAWVAADACSCS